MKILAVGAGPFGSEVVRDLSRDLPAIICQTTEGITAAQMVALFRAAQDSDLLFILSANEDQTCVATTRTIGEAGRAAGALCVAIIADLDTSCVDEPNRFSSVDTTFRVPAAEMRHIVMVITELLCQTSMIGIDFADVAMVLRGGKSGWLSIGTSEGEERSGAATARALERLAEQGVDIAKTTGVLAIVQSSAPLVLADYDAASQQLHDFAAKDANILVGLITDDQLENKVRVSVLTML